MNFEEPTDEQKALYKARNELCVGDPVIKISGKPFKSGNKTNRIKGFTVNENDPKKTIAATFEEDDSIVSVDKLKELRYGHC